MLGKGQAVAFELTGGLRALLVHPRHAVPRVRGASPDPRTSDWNYEKGTFRQFKIQMRFSRGEARSRGLATPQAKPWMPAYARMAGYRRHRLGFMRVDIRPPMGLPRTAGQINVPPNRCHQGEFNAKTGRH